MSELLDPSCFLSLTQPERLEQLYIAYGGTGCFMGYSRLEQLRLLAEQIGITDCIDLETDFWRAWLNLLDPEACSDPSLEGLQSAVYALLYAQAGDDTLVSPACFYGLSPDLKEQALFGVAIDVNSGTFTYLRPGGVDHYFRPDGTSTYLRH
jgi:hypothetical protein